MVGSLNEENNTGELSLDASSTEAQNLRFIILASTRFFVSIVCECWIYDRNDFFSSVFKSLMIPD